MLASVEPVLGNRPAHYQGVPMIKSTLLISAAALVLAGPALANTSEHHHARHAAHAHASAMHSDASVIDRCIDKRYAEKVACLRQARGGYTDQWNASGATSGAS